MLIEILNAHGDFEKVDINDFIKPHVQQYLEDAAEYGKDVTENEACEIMLDLASFRPNAMPSFAEIMCAKKGWQPFSASDANTTRQFSFTRRARLRTVYADTFLEAVKRLRLF